MPRGNSVASGFSPRAKMIKWYNESRSEFMAAYGKRAKVEAVFSSIKARMGTMIRAKSLETQAAELFGRIICHNMLLLP